MFGKLINWLRIPVAKVPEEIAVCEFDCVKDACRLQDWEHCERRLQAGKSPVRRQDKHSC